MITIINYGLGNIQSFVNVYKQLNIPVKVATTKEELSGATKIILPGVGAFDHAMKLLDQSGLRILLNELVLNKKIPVLGICVGMQMLAKSSEEGVLPGLGWIDGVVKKFNAAAIPYKPGLPHMGWNAIEPVMTGSLLQGLDHTPRFYFLHSYYFSCNSRENVIATTTYGITYASAVQSGNIMGVQFHPEKSHSNGVQVLHNFAKLNR
ncbi:MAG: imidazole glycerol phosphate synthase subunit HisH [Mangrovibacterium sp.]